MQNVEVWTRLFEQVTHDVKSNIWNKVRINNHSKSVFYQAETACASSTTKQTIFFPSWPFSSLAQTEEHQLSGLPYITSTWNALERNSFSASPSPKPMANALSPRRFNSCTWSCMIETNGVTTRTVALSNFHSTFMTRGSIWKIKLFPNPVGRIPKTSFHSATDRKQLFCSSFSPAICLNSRRESLKASSKSSFENLSLEDAMFTTLRQNKTGKICKSVGKMGLSIKLVDLVNNQWSDQ